MADVVFCQTRYHRLQYDDFWKLVHLSGYPIIYVDEIDPTRSDTTYIFTPETGENADGWPYAKARIIHYEMEWPYPDLRKPVPGVAETWCASKYFSTLIGARYVPLGSHPGLMLRQETGVFKHYDLMMLSYHSGRRQWAYERMLEQGLRFAPNAWGEERHQYLMQSRAMLHIHQWDHIFAVAPIRACIAAAYKMPFITEETWNGDYSPYGDTIIPVSYNRLTHEGQEGQPALKLLLREEYASTLEKYGQMLHEKLCIDMTFRRNIEAAL